MTFASEKILYTLLIMSSQWNSIAKLINYEEYVLKALIDSKIPSLIRIIESSWNQNHTLMQEWKKVEKKRIPNVEMLTLPGDSNRKLEKLLGVKQYPSISYVSPGLQQPMYQFPFQLSNYILLSWLDGIQKTTIPNFQRGDRLAVVPEDNIYIISVLPITNDCNTLCRDNAQNLFFYSAGTAPKSYTFLWFDSSTSPIIGDILWTFRMERQMVIAVDFDKRAIMTQTIRKPDDLQTLVREAFEKKLKWYTFTYVLNLLQNELR